MVFENESETTQDSSYREHLNNNWNNGNEAFDRLGTMISQYLENQNTILERLDALEERLNNLSILSQEIKDLTDDVIKLESAVFGDAVLVTDTDDKPDISTSQTVTEINDDKVPDKSTPDTSALVIESDNNSIIPDKVN